MVIILDMVNVMDKKDSTWLLTLAENINAYLKHHNEQKRYKGRFVRWIDPRLLIMVKLYTAYPEALPQSEFVDDMHCKMTISNAVHWLADQKLIIIDRLSKERHKPNYLHLSDAGKDFVNYASPD